MCCNNCDTAETSLIPDASILAGFINREPTMQSSNDLTRRFIAIAAGSGVLALVLCLTPMLSDTAPDAGAFAASGGLVADTAPAAPAGDAGIYAGPATNESGATTQ
jgi:hypothetical protein